MKEWFEKRWARDNAPDEPEPKLDPNGALTKEEYAKKREEDAAAKVIKDAKAKIENAKVDAVDIAAWDIVMASGDYNFNRQTSVCTVAKVRGRCPPGKHYWKNNPARSLKSVAAFIQAYNDPSATIAHRLRVAYLDRLIETTKKTDAAYQTAY